MHSWGDVTQGQGVPDHQALPTAVQLAEELQSVDTVVVAKIDGTANDWPHKLFPAPSYPTLYLVPARASAKKRPKPLKYSGERTYDALRAWLQDTATHPLPEFVRKEEEPEDSGVDDELDEL